MAGLCTISTTAHAATVAVAVCYGGPGGSYQHAYGWSYNNGPQGAIEAGSYAKYYAGIGGPICSVDTMSTLPYQQCQPYVVIPTDAQWIVKFGTAKTGVQQFFTCY